MAKDQWLSMPPTLMAVSTPFSYSRDNQAANKPPQATATKPLTGCQTGATEAPTCYHRSANPPSSRDNANNTATEAPTSYHRSADPLSPYGHIHLLLLQPWPPSRQQASSSHCNQAAGGLPNRHHRGTNMLPQIRRSAIQLWQRRQYRHRGADKLLQIRRSTIPRWSHSPPSLAAATTKPSTSLLKPLQPSRWQACWTCYHRSADPPSSRDNTNNTSYHRSADLSPNSRIHTLLLQSPSPSRQQVSSSHRNQTADRLPNWRHRDANMLPQSTRLEGWSTMVMVKDMGQQVATKPKHYLPFFIFFFVFLFSHYFYSLFWHVFDLTFYCKTGSS